VGHNLLKLRPSKTHGETCWKDNLEKKNIPPVNRLNTAFSAWLRHSERLTQCETRKSLGLQSKYRKSHIDQAVCPTSILALVAAKWHVFEPTSANHFPYEIGL
jgi:hypothetical protein